jgi:hypothetical protein
MALVAYEEEEDNGVCREPQHRARSWAQSLTMSIQPARGQAQSQRAGKLGRLDRAR